jgi:phage terminase small subunit
VSASPWPKPQPAHSPVTKLTPPPSHLEPPEATLFRELVRDFQIDDAGAISLLTAACEAHQRARRARERIDREGEVVTDRFGQPRAHPCICMERDSRDAFLRSMRALNLKPDAKPLGTARSSW